MFGRLSMRLVCAAVLAMGLLSAGNHPVRADAPATHPSAADQGGLGGLDPVQVVQRVRAAIGQLSDLTDDQKTQINAILDKADVEAKSLAPQVQDLQGRDRFQKLQPFFQDLRRQITPLLSDEQKQAVARKLGLDRPGQRMIEVFKEEIAKLDLADDQKKQIADLLTQTTKKVDDLRAGGAQGDDLRQQGQEIFQDFRDQIQQILSDDQQQQLREAMQTRFQAMRDGGGGRGASPDNTTRPSPPAN